VGFFRWVFWVFLGGFFNGNPEQNGGDIPFSHSHEGHIAPSHDNIKNSPVLFFAPKTVKNALENYTA